MSVFELVNVPYWWHASLLEVLWLAGGLAALGLAVFNLSDAWKDTAVLAEIRSDPSISERHYEMISVSAHGRLESQLFRVAISLLIVAAGVTGVLISNPAKGTTTLTGLAVSVALVGISLLTAVKSALDLSNRNRLYALASSRDALFESGKVKMPGG